MSDINSDDCKKRTQIIQGQRRELIVAVLDNDDGTPRVSDLAAATQIQSVHPKSTKGTFLIKELERSAVAEVTDILCLADVAGSLGGKYFSISSDTVLYKVWFNVDAGSTEPSLAGSTAVTVAISSGDSANTVATALQTALDALGDMGASVSTATVTVTNDTGGKAVDSVDAVPTALKTLFTFTVTTQGLAAVTDSIEVITGTSKIKIKLQGGATGDTLTLKVQTRATMHVAIDFALPLGRQIYKVLDAYDVCEAEFTLDANT